MKLISELGRNCCGREVNMDEITCLAAYGDALMICITIVLGSFGDVLRDSGK